MGGIALPAVINYGYGYLQGANDAAMQSDIKIDMMYTYTGTFNEDPAVKTKAAKWYDSGLEVIFSCGGGICNSIFPAAKEAEKFAIGVDSKLVDYKNDKFKGGIETLDATGGYIGLPKDFEHLGNFNEDAYNEIFTKIANGSVKIKTRAEVDNDNKDNGNPAKLKLSNVNITYDK